MHEDRTGRKPCPSPSCMFLSSGSGESGLSVSSSILPGLSSVPQTQVLRWLFRRCSGRPEVSVNFRNSRDASV